jgi:hypothetical protein
MSTTPSDQQIESASIHILQLARGCYINGKMIAELMDQSRQRFFSESDDKIASPTTAPRAFYSILLIQLTGFSNQLQMISRLSDNMLSASTVASNNSAFPDMKDRCMRLKTAMIDASSLSMNSDYREHAGLSPLKPFRDDLAHLDERLLDLLDRGFGQAISTHRWLRARVARMTFAKDEGESKRTFKPIWSGRCEVCNQPINGDHLGDQGSEQVSVQNLLVELSSRSVWMFVHRRSVSYTCPSERCYAGQHFLNEDAATSRLGVSDRLLECILDVATLGRNATFESRRRSELMERADACARAMATGFFDPSGEA